MTLPPPGYFSVKFVSNTLSRYSGLYSKGISQVDLLCNFLDTEKDDEMDVMMRFVVLRVPGFRAQPTELWLFD